MNKVISMVNEDQFIPFEEQNQFINSSPVFFTPIKKYSTDSDQDSIDTNDSISENSIQTPIQKVFSKLLKEQPEIDVQPKRKQFSTIEQKEKYIEDYQRKYKTEVCKNWQIKGACPYGDKCCFAHGYNELQTRTHLKQTYKTKPCKKFFEDGFCPYGYRCQYLHSDLKQLPQFENYLENIYKEKKIQFTLKKCLENKKDSNTYIDKLNSLTFFGKKQRLQAFQNLEEEQQQTILQQTP